MELNWPIIQQYDFIMTSNYFLVSVNLCLDNGHGYKGYTILCDCGGCIMGRFAIKHHYSHHNNNELLLLRKV